MIAPKPTSGTLKLNSKCGNKLILVGHVPELRSNQLVLAPLVKVISGTRVALVLCPPLLSPPLCFLRPLPKTTKTLKNPKPPYRFLSAFGHYLPIPLKGHAPLTLGDFLAITPPEGTLLKPTGLRKLLNFKRKLQNSKTSSRKALSRLSPLAPPPPLKFQPPVPNPQSLMPPSISVMREVGNFRLLPIWRLPTKLTFLPFKRLSSKTNSPSK